MLARLDHRLSALEIARKVEETEMTLIFATGETCVIPQDFFKKFLVEKRPPGSMALPTHHDPDLI